jgi:hypothetical protein
MTHQMFMRFITPPFEDRVSLHAKSLIKLRYNCMVDKALLAKIIP